MSSCASVSTARTIATTGSGSIYANSSLSSIGSKSFEEKWKLRQAQYQNRWVAENGEMMRQNSSQFVGIHRVVSRDNGFSTSDSVEIQDNYQESCQFPNPNSIIIGQETSKVSSTAPALKTVSFDDDIQINNCKFEYSENSEGSDSSGVKVPSLKNLPKENGFWHNLLSFWSCTTSAADAVVEAKRPQTPPSPNASTPTMTTYSGSQYTSHMPHNIQEDFPSIQPECNDDDEASISAYYAHYPHMADAIAHARYHEDVLSLERAQEKLRRWNQVGHRKDVYTHHSRCCHDDLHNQHQHSQFPHYQSENYMPFVDRVPVMPSAEDLRPPFNKDDEPEVLHGGYFHPSFLSSMSTQQSPVMRSRGSSRDGMFGAPSPVSVGLSSPSAAILAQRQMHMEYHQQRRAGDNDLIRHTTLSENGSGFDNNSNHSANIISRPTSARFEEEEVEEEDVNIGGVYNGGFAHPHSTGFSSPSSSSPHTSNVHLHPPFPSLLSHPSSPHLHQPPHRLVVQPQHLSHTSASSSPATSSPQRPHYHPTTTVVHSTMNGSSLYGSSSNNSIFNNNNVHSSAGCRHSAVRGFSSSTSSSSSSPALSPRSMAMTARLAQRPLPQVGLSQQSHLRPRSLPQPILPVSSSTSLMAASASFKSFQRLSGVCEDSDKSSEEHKSFLRNISERKKGHTSEQEQLFHQLVSGTTPQLHNKNGPANDLDLSSDEGDMERAIQQSIEDENQRRRQSIRDRLALNRAFIESMRDLQMQEVSVPSLTLTSESMDSWA